MPRGKLHVCHWPRRKWGGWLKLNTMAALMHTHTQLAVVIIKRNDTLLIIFCNIILTRIKHRLPESLVLNLLVLSTEPSYIFAPHFSYHGPGSSTSLIAP